MLAISMEFVGTEDWSSLPPEPPFPELEPEDPEPDEPEPEDPPELPDPELVEPLFEAATGWTVVRTKSMATISALRDTANPLRSR